MARTEAEVNEATRVYERIDGLRKRLAHINTAAFSGQTFAVEFNGSGMKELRHSERVDTYRSASEPRWKTSGIAPAVLAFLRKEARAEMRDLGRRLAQLCCAVPEDCL